MTNVYLGFAGFLFSTVETERAADNTDTLIKILFETICNLHFGAKKPKQKSTHRSTSYMRRRQKSVNIT